MAKTSLKLPERFDINQVEDMQTRMQTALDKDAEQIDVNAVSVRLMDSSCLQLLLAFVAEAQKRGKTIRVLKQSEEFGFAAELLGVRDLMEELS